MKMFKKIVCVVLDGVGVGEAPDAAAFGDGGSNSLGNTARHVGELRLPSLERLGLGNIISIEGVPPVVSPRAYHGKMTPVAPGKDSTSGHWELMGCVLEQPFPVYDHGFPDEIIEAFETRTGSKVIGNKPASGTVIIEELGADHMRTGDPILYTSQDSVFQIAAHESVIPLSELYRMCETARSILQHPHNVARVIARPFLGEPGGFYRTAGRRDFSLPPSKETILDRLVDNDLPVHVIGKIHDLFAGRGITTHVPTKSNRDGMSAMLDALAGGDRSALVFTNLVDFDTMWGHRNDPRAYALGLEEFDSHLGPLLSAMGDDVLLIITSDHGTDPTTPSTDHSREYVPLLVYYAGAPRDRVRDLGVRTSFADVGKTIADNFGLAAGFPGRSFLGDIV
ncbi:MAG: phosphopentomutase [Candidatus Latescibacterota bacterium]|nr:MAG: phosphopentomutase [Candidatus Latescibacterota bacterium]